MWQINIYILHIPQFFDEIITTQTFTVQLSSRTYHEFDFLILRTKPYGLYGALSLSRLNSYPIFVHL